jgi:uncharacterized spore protein YtfJ
MTEAEQMYNAAAGEIERVLSSKHVVGEPIVLNGATVIPLMSVGFAVGLGSGTGNDPKRGQGGGSGFGGGGGIRPIAVLISDANGVRVEAIKPGAAGAFARIAEEVSGAIARRGQSNGAEKAPG